MKKIIKLLIDIVFIIIIVILAGYFIFRLTGKLNTYRVETGSMEPAIHVNDYIMVFETNDYKEKDIVTFKYENTLVTHRIVEVNDNKVTTKGDANNTNDDEIDKSSIVGEVILAGGIINFIINYKFVIIAVMIVIYLLSCYIEKDKEQIKKEDKDEEK